MRRARLIWYRNDLLCNCQVVQSSTYIKTRWHSISQTKWSWNQQMTWSGRIEDSWFAKKSPDPILPILLCIIGLSVCKVCRRGIFSWKTQEKCSILSKLFCLKSFCAQYLIILIRPNIICKSENSRFQNHNSVRICTLPPQWGCKYGWTGGKTWFVYAKQPTMRLIGLERG